MSDKNIVYFDLETQRSANDVGGWGNKDKMGMSLGVIYSTGSQQYEIYSEKRVGALIDQLVKADLVVGYNVINFDYQLLQGYTVLDMESATKTCDTLLEVEKKTSPSKTSQTPLNLAPFLTDPFDCQRPTASSHSNEMSEPSF